MGNYRGTIIGVIKGDTRSLDYSSYVDVYLAKKVYTRYSHAVLTCSGRCPHESLMCRSHGLGVALGEFWGLF